MIGLLKLLWLTLLTVTAFLPSVAAAQVVPTSYSLDVGGQIYDHGDYGGGARHLATDDVWEFSSRCGENSCLHGRLSNSATTIETSLLCNRGESGLDLWLRFTAGSAGAMVRCNFTELNVRVEVEAVEIPAAQSFWLSPNQTAEVFLSSRYDELGSMQVVLEAGSLINVFAQISWSREAVGGDSVGGGCSTIGCKPEVDYPEGDCSADCGSGEASVDPNRIELTLDVNGNAWASQSLQFTLVADCCVTYYVDAIENPYSHWHVSFLNPDEMGHHSGKVSVPAGSYSASLSAEFWDAYMIIVLVFDYEFCDEDCDADGQLDSNQIKWGWAPDVNSNGALDVCDLRGGDLNLDGVVGSADLTLLLGAWGGTLPEIIDLTGDGVVSTADLSFLFSKWNT